MSHAPFVIFLTGLSLALFFVPCATAFCAIFTSQIHSRDLLLKEKPDTISYIFEAYELLRSLSLIVGLLDYKQIKPRTKTAWNIDAIRSILKDPLCYDFPSLFEPGVKEAYVRCQKILAEQTAGNTQTHMRSYCHVFSGLLYCSVCGKSMSARDNYLLMRMNIPETMDKTLFLWPFSQTIFWSNSSQYSGFGYLSAEFYLKIFYNINIILL